MNKFRVYIVAAIVMAALTARAENSSNKASSLEAIAKNREAIKHLEKENPTAAEDALVSALGLDPFNPILHLNLGLVFELQEKYDKAIKEDESVLRIDNVAPEAQFYAHFNAGNAEAKKEELALALQHFQAALDLKPDSVETKTNIELLIKSGAGQGKGKSKGGKGKDDDNKDDNKDKEGNKGDKPDPMKDPLVNGRDQKPKFNSETLTKEDVRKILDEIKSQEQHIRALDYANKNKDTPPAKDW
jgi:Ca-activated chloride channel homolog